MGLVLALPRASALAVAVSAIGWHAAIRSREILCAVAASVVMALASAAGPLGTASVDGFRPGFPLTVLFGTVHLAAAFLVLRATAHSLHGEGVSLVVRWPSRRRGGE
jgi:hypothetical protein